MKKLVPIIIILLALLVGWLYYRQSILLSGMVTIGNTDFSASSLRYSININEQSHNPMDLVVSEIPLKAAPKDRKVYFYSDSSYPILGTSANSVLGIYEHLLSEYQQKNISGQVVQIDSIQLADALNDPSSIIVVASGVLPDTVYSPDKNLITPWVEKGGTLFWIGDALGYYYGVSGTEINSADSPYAIGWSGQERILGQNFLKGEYLPSVSNSKGDYATPLATALGIRSSYTQTGAFASLISKNNDNDLGYHYNFSSDSRTSLSDIKIGGGSLFIFGSFLLNKEIDFAWDISQIIVSGFLDADVSNISYKKVPVSTGDKYLIERNIIVGDSSRVRIIIFSTNPAKSFFLSKDLIRGKNPN